MKEHGGDYEVKEGREGHFWNPMGFLQDLKFLGSLQRRKGHSNEYLSQTHRDHSYSHYPDFLHSVEMLILPCLHCFGHGEHLSYLLASWGHLFLSRSSTLPKMMPGIHWLSSWVPSSVLCVTDHSQHSIMVKQDVRVSHPQRTRGDQDRSVERALAEPTPQKDHAGLSLTSYLALPSPPPHSVNSEDLTKV